MPSKPPPPETPPPPSPAERLRATLRPEPEPGERRRPSSSQNPAVKAFRRKLQSIVENTLPQLDKTAADIEEYAQRVQSDRPPADDAAAAEKEPHDE